MSLSKLTSTLHESLTSKLVGVTAVAAAAVSYLLKATFNASDQSFIDAQVLDTAAEGVETGQLTVSLSGLAAEYAKIVSNELEMYGDNNWDGVMLVGEAQTRAIGLACLIQENGATVCQYGWNNVAGGTQVGKEIGVKNQTATLKRFATASIGDKDILNSVNGQVYQFAFILGGYDVNGVPYKAGDTKANFTYGGAIFAKGAADLPNWSLLYRDKNANAATVYPYINTRTGNAFIFDDLKVPDADLSNLLEPVVLDTFTDTNGTSLDAHTMDVGSGWTEHLGVWEIQSNEAKTTSVSTLQLATILTLYADAIIEVAVTTSVNSFLGIAFRFTDTDNAWWAELDAGGDRAVIKERTSATTTLRAETAVTIDDATTYRLVVILDGDVITVIADDTVRVTYTSSVRNTVKTHGLKAYRASEKFDNFAVYPRGAGAEYSDLDTY